jgi:SAM-dependent methyltransferase
MHHGEDLFDKNYYQRFFQDYNKKELLHYERWFDGWVRFLNRFLPLKKGQGKKVLEIGCSLGYFTTHLERRGFEIIATDISSFIVKKAKLLHPEIKFLTLDVQKKITIEEKFDYVFTFEVLEHLQDPTKALHNIYEKLAKGGVLVFSTPFPSSRSLGDPTHISIHEPSWWLKEGKSVGFKKRRLVYVTFLPYLYRFGRFFSVGLPFKVDVPFINSTCMFFFEK